MYASGWEEVRVSSEGEGEIWWLWSVEGAGLEMAHWQTCRTQYQSWREVLSKLSRQRAI